MPKLNPALDITVLLAVGNPVAERLIESDLRQLGYDVSVSSGDDDTVFKASSAGIGAVVFELFGLGSASFSTLELLRQSYEGPLIAFSMDNQFGLITQALDLGADDYLVDGLGTHEPGALVQSAIERSDRFRCEASSWDEVNAGTYRISPATRSVVRDGNQVILTQAENEVLRMLAVVPGEVRSYGELLREVWGKEHEQDVPRVRTYIRQLRKKLEADPSRPSFILTQPGSGYRLGVK